MFFHIQAYPAIVTHKPGCGSGNRCTTWPAAPLEPGTAGSATHRSIQWKERFSSLPSTLGFQTGGWRWFPVARSTTRQAVPVPVVRVVAGRGRCPLGAAPVPAWGPVVSQVVVPAVALVPASHRPHPMSAAKAGWEFTSTQACPSRSSLRSTVAS